MDTKSAVIGAVIVALAISAAMNYMLYNQVRHLDQQVSTLQSDMNLQNTDSQAQNKTQSQVKPPYELSTDNESKKSITAVAVRQIPTNDFFQSYTFEGTTMKITVEIRSGDGKILVNTATATGVDFQSSARTAVETAEKIANVDLSSSDVIFSIESESDIEAVDCPSAGGAMTVLLISELMHKDIRTDVLMTGTINTDGSVGRVGGIMEKADAAGKYGAKIFLVPDKQSTVKVESCEEKKVGPALYRTCKFEPASLSEITHDKYGMDVIEIKNIQEAMSYFTA